MYTTSQPERILLDLLCSVRNRTQKRTMVVHRDEFDQNCTKTSCPSTVNGLIYKYLWFKGAKIEGLKPNIINLKMFGLKFENACIVLKELAVSFTRLLTEILANQKA